MVQCNECGREITNITDVKIGPRQGQLYQCECGFICRREVATIMRFDRVPAEHVGHSLLQKHDGTYYCYTCAGSRARTAPRRHRPAQPDACIREIKLHQAVLTLTLAGGDMLSMVPADYKLVSDIRRLMRLYMAGRSANVRDIGPRRTITGEVKV